jgi:hypothetical protein
MALQRQVDVEALENDVLTPAMLAEAKRQVEENRLALEMLDRGAKMPGCNYDIGLRYGFAASVPHLINANKLADVASLRTCVLAFDREGDRAVESAIASLGMLRILDRQPVVGIYFLRINCRSLFTRDVRAILEHGRASPEALERLSQALADSDASVDFRRVCLAHRVYCLELMRNIIAGGRQLRASRQYDLPLPELPEQWPNDLGTRMMLARTLPMYERFVDAAATGFPNAIDAMQAMDQECRSSGGWAGLPPSLHDAMLVVARGMATSHVARLAVWIEQYRLANGRLPQSLAELPQADSLPSDPFTGKGFVYRLTSDGYVLYSLGANRRDDGAADLDGKGGDVGMTVRLPRTR